MAEYDREEHEGGGGFMMGLLTGTVLGAGLGMLLAPKRGSELRTQIGEGASSLGRRASEMADRARESMNRGVDQIRSRSDAPATMGAAYFSIRCAVGDLPQTSRAHCSAVDSSSACGTTAFTPPIACICSAVYSRPRKKISRANFWPTKRAR